VDRGAGNIIAQGDVFLRTDRDRRLGHAVAATELIPSQLAPDGRAALCLIENRQPRA
jgi:hypothetical protein